MGYQGPMRRSTDHPPTFSAGWFKRLWQGFVNHLTNTKTPMGLVYLGAVVMFFGFRGVLDQQERLFDAQREADLLDTQRALYQAAVNDWAGDSAAYALCLDGVSRSDLNRQQWENMATGLEAEFGPNQVTDLIRNGPVLSSPPRTPAECNDPGPAPSAPEIKP